MYVTSGQHQRTRPWGRRWRLPFSGCGDQPPQLVYRSTVYSERAKQGEETGRSYVYPAHVFSLSGKIKPTVLSRKLEYVCSNKRCRTVKAAASQARAPDRIAVHTPKSSRSSSRPYRLRECRVCGNLRLGNCCVRYKNAGACPTPGVAHIRGDL